MTRYWASWWEPLNPEGKQFKGLKHAWLSGYRYPDKELPDCPTCGQEVEYVECSMVALLEGDEPTLRKQAEAKRTITEWRFFNEVAYDWTPGDRFPMATNA